MELHQLEYVIAVDKYKHFSLAAEEINISQPTLSHQIKKLEEELGVDLFVRTTRSVQLTPAGKEFLVYAKRVISELKKARAAMLEHTQLQKGSINIGAIPNITHLGITAVIAEFQRTYPGIHMELYEENSDDLLKKMHTYEIDVAFITSPFVSDIEFDFYPLINDELVVLLARSHPLAKKQAVDLAELSQEKFLMIKSSSGLRNELIQGCRSAGFEPNIIFESGHVETINGLVGEGVGIALFSRRVAASLQNSKTAIVPLTTSIRRVTGLAVSKNSNLLSTKAFRDFVLQRYQPGE